MLRRRPIGRVRGFGRTGGGGLRGIETAATDLLGFGEAFAILFVSLHRGYSFSDL